MIDAYFNAEQMDKVQASVDSLCAEVRKYAGMSQLFSYCMSADKQYPSSTPSPSQTTLSTLHSVNGMDQSTNPTLPKYKHRTHRSRNTRTSTD
jgi:hypothetical protein